ncbi:Uncharacterized protein LCER1_G003443 [Lachnellula cervina]|uniref:Thioredoxin-like protein n=1 Tax=Lachnellula cervina TaxID=1316786 RepID=A0A7D8UUI2_9HELO|nr:Uncharacterized protein LCER1_G003443 [Lachnellula cervina]
MSDNPYYSDPALYLYTSLTSGSSHIVTATSRLETILKANKIPFKALDIATDEKARQIWGRRAGKDESGRPRKMPGLVQEGFVLGVGPLPSSEDIQSLTPAQDLVEIEDWNEYGELRQHVKIVKNKAAKSGPSTPLSKLSDAVIAAQENKKPTSTPTPTTSTAPAASSKFAEAPVSKSKPPIGGAPTTISLALRQAGQEAAQKAKDNKKKPPVETFDGVGEAEPPTEKEKAIPAPITIPEAQHAIETPTLMQSPTSTTWRRAPGSGFEVKTPRHSISKLESMQSPNSTAWKPTDIDPAVLTHRGSKAGEVKQVQEKSATKEEEGKDDDEEKDSEDEDEEDSEEEEEVKE